MPKISALGGMSSRGFGEFAQQSSGAYIEDVFSTYLYDGTDAPQTISNGIDLSGNGGLVWLKSRAGTVVTGYDKHILFDTVRTNTNSLTTNSSAAVESGWSDSYFRFRSNGFDFGTSTSTTDQSYLNNLGVSYVSWTFREKTKFFDVVSYTGNGANRTIAHNLGSVPGMIIIKRTNATSNWAVYHRSLANTEYLGINTTAAATTDATYWNSTTPTATEFSLGTSGVVNTSGGTYIAYLFAHDAGGFGLTGGDNVISCGSYTGNGSATGPTINLGWEPQFLIIKDAGPNVGNWGIYDNIRGIATGGNDSYIWANLTLSEQLADWISLNSTGFQITSTNGSVNTNGDKYIYMAIRRGPMKTPTDATTVFKPTVYTGTNVNNRLVNTTIAPDMVWIRQRNDTVLGGMVVADRLRGQPYSLTGTTAAEVTSATAFDQQIVNSVEYGTAFSSMNGVWVGTDATAKLNVNTTASNHIAEAFKRAPGFFDSVAYTGTGVARTISHNLNAVPELILIKQRISSSNWVVYSSPTGISNYLLLNSNIASASDAPTVWNSTNPTSSVFSLGTISAVNANSITFISYLFTSCPGVSKVGSYTGTGTTQQINCGFTSGARLVLIKRTDTTGDWYIYDSARGIVAGNDPYILLNSAAAEVTSTDYVDTYSAGFELSSTAPAGLNEQQGTTWTLYATPFGTQILRCATFGNGLYVIAGDSGALATSSNGTSWTSRTSNFNTSAILAITYGNGLFVAVGENGLLATSTDGITWTLRTSGFGTSSIRAVTYGGGLFVAAGDSGKLFTSTDGITWNSQSSGTAAQINTLAYGNSLYLLGTSTGSLRTSSDGVTWTGRTSGFGANSINSITYGNSLYIAGGNGGTLATSTDGITWTSRTSGFGATNILTVSYGGGVYIAGGNTGTITTSIDGITWTSRTSGFGANAIYGITYGNGSFVETGNGANAGLSIAPSYLYLAIA